MKKTGWEEGFLQQELTAPPAANQLTQMAQGVWHIQSLGNAGFVETEEGVVVIDTGNPLRPDAVIGPLRQVTQERVHTIIYTHGHADHAANAQVILDEAANRGDPRPRIIGHRNIVKRMERYKLLHSQNDFINRLQFRLPPGHVGFPPDAHFVRPDELYDDSFTFVLGTQTFELHPYKAETDDGFWVFLPQQRAIFSGDAYISSCPNAGNPLKTQRYPLEWSDALKAMATREPEVLGPGHGTVLHGRVLIQEALQVTERALRYLHNEVVARLNAGQLEARIVREVRLPAELANHWALLPVYGKPEWVVISICRQYCGWWDGNPTHLAPSSPEEVARELVVLLGGTQPLLERAEVLLQDNHPQRALHLIDIVLSYSEDHAQARSLQMQALQGVRALESSYIAQSIYDGCIAELASKYVPVDEAMK